MKIATIVGVLTTIALMLAVLPATSAAQAAAVYGAVTDANGVPVPGATVTLIDDYFSSIAATTTDANGNFRFANVSLPGSNLVKPIVTYVRDGRNFSTQPNNVPWLDASAGLLSVPAEATRLYDYPLSDHGYVWGVVLSGLPNGKTLDSTVYLTNGSVTLSRETDRQGAAGAFVFEASPGTYEIFAVHCAGESCLITNRTTIAIEPARDYMQIPPINLIADQPVAAKDLAGIPTATATTAPTASPRPTTGTPPPGLPSPSPVPAGDLKIVPLAIALVIGAAFVFGAWALLMRK